MRMMLVATGAITFVNAQSDKKAPGNVQRLNSVERSVIRNVRKNVTKSAISP